MDEEDATGEVDCGGAIEVEPAGIAVVEPIATDEDPATEGVTVVNVSFAKHPEIFKRNVLS